MIDILRACAVKFRFGYIKNVTINLIVQKMYSMFFFALFNRNQRVKRIYIYIIIKMQAMNQENRFSGNENRQMCDLC